MIGLVALAAAADDDIVWAQVRDADDAARARAAGLAFGESHDGAYTLFYGTPAQAERAGLAWRAAAAPDDTYAPTAAEIAARLDALVEAGAGELVDVGTSASGTSILALRMGEGRRALRVLGGHHGDEGSSVEVALATAEALAAEGLPPDTEVWIVPTVNPDGLVADTRWSATGVDLNRNYAEMWSATEPRAGTAPFSEPETRAIRALARARDFGAGLSLHSGAVNFGWVWNWSTDVRPPEEPLFLSMGEDYRDGCGAPDFWITNGADWYVTRGDTTDWTYGAWGAHDFTLELTDTKSPPADEVEAYVAWHLDAILAWVARPPDVTGHVVDAVTGDSLSALLTAPDTADAWTGPDGQLSRWALDADTAWTVAAPGYTSAPLTSRTALVPDTLLDALPSPRLLSRGEGARTVTLPGLGDGPLTLVQPGEDDVTLEADAPGAWTVDPEALAPGAWTLVVGEGVVPRGLFVGEVDDRVRIDDVALEGGVLTVWGEGFGRGAEAWSIGGAGRAMHPLPRIDGTADTLDFPLVADDEDVLVWTHGAWLSVIDVDGDPAFDETPPPAVYVPTPDVIDATLDAPGHCASASGVGVGGLWTALAVLAGLRRGRGASALP